VVRTHEYIYNEDTEQPRSSRNKQKRRKKHYSVASLPPVSYWRAVVHWQVVIVIVVDVGGLWCCSQNIAIGSLVVGIVEVDAVHFVGVDLAVQSIAPTIFQGEYPVTK
jgi:hypothetical protein